MMLLLPGNAPDRAEITSSGDLLSRIQTEKTAWPHIVAKRHRSVRAAAPAMPASLVAQIIRGSDQPVGWLAFNGDKSIHMTADQSGFVMYSPRGNHYITLGDPVGPTGINALHLGQMIDDFMAFSHQQGIKPVFYQIDHHTRHLYEQRGFRLFKLGEEAHIRLADFTMKGKNYLKLRYNHGKAQRDGLRVEIVSGDDCAAMLPAMRAISDIWLAGKKTAEKGFSLGRFDPDFLLKNPCGLVWHEDRLVGFASLLVSDSKKEILVDLMRYRPDTPHGTMDFLFVETCLWARAQGYERLNIGLAPLSGLEQPDQPLLWRKAGALITTHGKRFYNFAGVREFKQKFRPEWHPKYLAVPAGCNPYRALLGISLWISGGWRGLIRQD